MRTRQEWREHPQGKLPDAGPLIRIEKIGDSAPQPFPALDPDTAPGPLAGLRVLDNTHVVAGPVAARIFAESGADVLHLSAPQHTDTNSLCGQDLGLVPRSAAHDLPRPQLGGRIEGLASVDGPWGTLRYLPTQIEYSTLAPHRRRSSEPLGAAPRAWWRPRPALPRASVPAGVSRTPLSAGSSRARCSVR